MLRLRYKLLVLCVLVGISAVSPAVADTQEIRVDWTKPVGPINRAVFGIEGFPKVFAVAQNNPRLMETFLRLNPSGQVARMETWVGYFEPENDNDDPEVFDWDRLHPEKMTRFIEDRSAFTEFLMSIDAELMPLVCYNTEWLDSGDPNDPVGDKDEWVEFAAGVTHAWNVLEPDAPQVKYLEVWNEPNMPMFYGGTRESYFEIFKKTAERYHRDYPGVQVGGPALTPAYWAEPEEWYRDFIEQVGQHADYVTHHIYHDATRSAADVAKEVVEKTDVFRALPGKEHGKLALTETDGWFNGWPKTQYLLGRHFEFLDIQERIVAVMHFTTLAYNESGEYIFGVMTEPGAPLADTYWPFWMVRNLAGELVESQDATDGFRVAATKHRNEHGEELFAAVVWNATEHEKTINVAGVLPASASGMMLRVDRLVEDGISTEIMPNGLPDELSLELAAGESAALTIYKPGQRHFAFSDLNDQEAPAVHLSSERLEVKPGGVLEMQATVTNTLDRPIRGKLTLADVPTVWTWEAKKRIRAIELQPGESRKLVFGVRADHEPPPLDRMAVTEHAGLGYLNHAVAPVAVWEDAAGHHTVSLPVDMVYVTEEPADHAEAK